MPSTSSDPWRLLPAAVDPTTPARNHVAHTRFALSGCQTSPSVLNPACNSCHITVLRQRPQSTRSLFPADGACVCHRRTPQSLVGCENLRRESVASLQSVPESMDSRLQVCSMAVVLRHTGDFSRI